jgi:four helix bundle protein
LGHSYKELIVWQKAKRLAVAVYKVSKSFPRDEIYGLTAQARRSAVSVVSNIAEGQGRMTTGEFVQFLGHARGSLLELQTQLEIALDLEYVSAAQAQELESLSNDVRALLNRLIESLQTKSKAAGV